MPYPNSAFFEGVLSFMESRYDFTRLLELPERSHEGRRISALRIGRGTRGGVLFTAGVHARELVPPLVLTWFAEQLCHAYRHNIPLKLGPREWPAWLVRRILDSFQIFVVPNVNPDGRDHVLTPGGDPMWRHNRSPNGGHRCKGVDVNRNCDFLWASGIGTSPDPCSAVFKGSGAFSEPETRNVRHLLDAHPHIDHLVDVHSYSELILYPWGDDSNQSTNPNMNFRNPAYDGRRGDRTDPAYAEYIPRLDETWFRETGAAMRDAIASVRGRVYRVQPSVDLYPTSGTIKDYAYSRHFVNASHRKVRSYTLETGLEFQPADAEAQAIMLEVSAGLFAFCERAVTRHLDAMVIRQTVPRRLTPGQTATATITVRNVGAAAWSAIVSRNPDRLGAQSPQDNQTWGRHRVELPISKVTPGTEVTFRFQITAPETPGLYDFQWRMVRELTSWYGDPTPRVRVLVQEEIEPPEPLPRP
jgi:carboxypeptidase T